MNLERKRIPKFEQLRYGSFDKIDLDEFIKTLTNLKSYLLTDKKALFDSIRFSAYCSSEDGYYSDEVIIGLDYEILESDFDYNKRIEKERMYELTKEQRKLEKARLKAESEYKRYLQLKEKYERTL